MKKYDLEVERLAYSPAQLAKACGKSLSWAYRQIYAGKLNVITDMGAMLIPATELDRVLRSAQSYSPRPKKRKEEKQSPRQ